MSRGTRPHAWRAAEVWMVVTAVAGVATAASAPVVGAHEAWASTTTFPDLLVRVCASALVLAVLWLWVVTTATVAQLVRGRLPRAGGATSRLVLLACGAVLATGAVTPASAADGDEVLIGLRLPERSVGSAVTTAVTPSAVPASARPASAGIHVVRAGESLWSIAEATSPPGSDLDLRWRAIWAANRDVVGDDPDLILPGQRLRLPTSPDETTDQTTDETTDETGDRP